MNRVWVSNPEPTSDYNEPNARLFGLVLSVI